jgi:hypothetical protein
MTHSDEANRSQKPIGSRPSKRPYLKPEFRHEKVFETMALSCGKVVSSQGGCHSNRKSS